MGSTAPQAGWGQGDPSRKGWKTDRMDGGRLPEVRGRPRVVGTHSANSLLKTGCLPIPFLTSSHSDYYLARSLSPANSVAV